MILSLLSKEIFDKLSEPKFQSLKKNKVKKIIDFINYVVVFFSQTL